MYISENPLLNDPARIWKAWFQPGSFVEYYPLEQTVQYVQWRLWGDDTLGYHLTNVFLHVLNALLVWKLLSKFGLRSAWLGGLLFAVHPTMVESVAWISELKNTLSLPPFLLSLCFWIDYEEKGRGRDYAAALALFILSMLCKISVAPFFAVILLYAWWKRGRIGWRDAAAATPFLVVALFLVYIAYISTIWYCQTQSKVPDVPHVGGFLFRLALAGQILSFYFVKCVWPAELTSFYPQWEVDPASPVQFLPLLIFAAVFFCLWRKRQGWGRHVLLGLGFFILILGPFLGFIPVTYLSFTWVMDHYLYIPIIGIIGIVVAGIDDLSAKLGPSFRMVRLIVLTLVVTILAFKSHGYASVFSDDETFWTYAGEHNPQAWGPPSNLGELYLKLNQPARAMQEYETAIRLKPELVPDYIGLATAYLQMGRIAEAANPLIEALKIDPGAPEPNNNLALILDHLGRTDEAISHLQRALKTKPLYLDAHNNLGHIFFETGRANEASEQFQLALQIDPFNATALAGLAALQKPGPSPAVHP
jgi:hypothetical protein